MADRGSGGGTGMALIVGGLVVAVGFIVYFLFGDQIVGDSDGVSVNVETSAGGGDGGTTGGATEGTATEGTTGGATEGTATEGSTNN